MRIFLLISILLSVSISGQKTEIMKVLTEQQQAWNRGDLGGYMEGYWNSSELVFIGKNGPTYGWQQTMDNYKRSYPDTVKMGKLTFSNVRVKKLSSKYAFVTGAWRLDRTSDVLQGFYSLLFRKIKGEWKIVADHSS